MAVEQRKASPFTGALEALRKKKDLVSTDAWYDVVDDANLSAYTVAGLTKEDLLADLKDLVDQAKREGIPLDQFKKEFKARAQAKGWSPVPGGDNRIRTHIHTNTRTAYNAGREAQIEKAKKLRPYGLYKIGYSKEHRPKHQERDGWVVHLEDSFWDYWTPSNGFGCNCKKLTLSERDVERRGFKILKPNIELIEVELPNGEKVKTVDGVDPSFAYNPGKISRQEVLKNAVKSRADGVKLSNVVESRREFRARRDPKLKRDVPGGRSMVKNNALWNTLNAEVKQPSLESASDQLFKRVGLKGVKGDADLLKFQAAKRKELDASYVDGKPDLKRYSLDVGAIRGKVSRLDPALLALQQRDAVGFAQFVKVSGKEDFLGIVQAVERGDDAAVFRGLFALKAGSQAQFWNVALERMFPNTNAYFERVLDQRRK